MNHKKNKMIAYAALYVVVGFMAGFILCAMYSDTVINYNLAKIEEEIIGLENSMIITGNNCYYDYNNIKNQLQNKTLEIETQQALIQEYKLIIKNIHDNYNNQDERFESMVDYLIEAREAKLNADYNYALCYAGIYPHRMEFENGN